LYGCETWYLTLREEDRLRIFENMVLWIYSVLRGRKWQVTGEDYTIKNFITCTLHSILSGRSNEEG